MNQERNRPIKPLQESSRDLVLVVPAAGKGTRLRPATTFVPKGMVPLMDRPILEYVLEVGLQAPISRIILIVSPDGDAIRDHFRENYRGVPISYVVQEDPKGLTHAVSLAQPYVKDRMLILLSDELYLDCSHSGLAAIVDERGASGLVGFVRTNDEYRIRRNYAIDLNGHTAADPKISRLIEKPEEIWNDMQGTGTWLFEREFFDFVPKTAPHPKRGEPDFVAVIQEMVNAGRSVYAIDLGGTYLNINDPDDLSTAISRLSS